MLHLTWALVLGNLFYLVFHCEFDVEMYFTELYILDEDMLDNWYVSMLSHLMMKKEEL